MTMSGRFFAPVGEYIYRQIAQYTAGRFVFLTYRDAADPGSGPGTQTVHDVKQYSVQTLDRLGHRLSPEDKQRFLSIATRQGKRLQPLIPQATPS